MFGSVSIGNRSIEWELPSYQTQPSNIQHTFICYRIKQLNIQIQNDRQTRRTPSILCYQIVYFEIVYGLTVGCQQVSYHSCFLWNLYSSHSACRVHSRSLVNSITPDIIDWLACTDYSTYQGPSTDPQEIINKNVIARTSKAVALYFYQGFCIIKYLFNNTPYNTECCNNS